jgi:hypothetical protein
MKRIVLLLICMSICFACNDDEGLPLEVDLVGEWRLVENLADPGTGTGTFQPVNSQKVITFHEDGRITSNGSLCDITITSDNPTEGVYSLIDSTFTTQACGFDGTLYSFEKNRNTITIYYLCIEACGSKYVKQ